MKTNNKKPIKSKKPTTSKKTKGSTKSRSLNTRDVVIQVGLALYFTIYFIAHHYLGVYNTRWIFYLGIAAVVFYAFYYKSKKKEKPPGVINAEIMRRNKIDSKIQSQFNRDYDVSSV